MAAANPSRNEDRKYWRGVLMSALHDLVIGDDLQSRAMVARKTRVASERLFGLGLGREPGSRGAVGDHGGEVVGADDHVLPPDVGQQRRLAAGEALAGVDAGSPCGPTVEQPRVVIGRLLELEADRLPAGLVVLEVATDRHVRAAEPSAGPEPLERRRRQPPGRGQLLELPTREVFAQLEVESERRGLANLDGLDVDAIVVADRLVADLVETQPQR